MHADDAVFDLLERDFRAALALELFVEFSFVVALFAVAGAFAGGLPTSTPFGAVIYLVMGLLVTVPVTIQTRRMLLAAQRRDAAALKGFHVWAWGIVAFAFSAFLPAIYLNNAAATIQRRL